MEDGFIHFVMPDSFRHPLIHKSFGRCVCGTPAFARAGESGMTRLGDPGFLQAANILLAPITLNPV